MDEYQEENSVTERERRSRCLVWVVCLSKSSLLARYYEEDKEADWEPDLHDEKRSKPLPLCPCWSNNLVR